MSDKKLRGAVDTPVAVDPAPTRALYEHARWLFDAEDTRAASVESRAAALVGWSGAQLTLTLGVTTLTTGLPDGRPRMIGLWLLAGSVVLLVLAVIIVLFGVVLARTVVAPRRDLRDYVPNSWSKETPPCPLSATEHDLLARFVANLLAPGDKSVEGALLSWQKAIDRRAGFLTCATLLVAGSVLLAAAATVPFIISAQGA